MKKKKKQKFGRVFCIPTRQSKPNKKQAKYTNYIQKKKKGKQ